MIITVEDKTNCANLLYYQSLALLFLPCEGFAEHDTQNKMNVITEVTDKGLFAKVTLLVSEKKCCAEGFDEIQSDIKRRMKNLVGRTILDAFFKIFERKPPWGISTGVKPVKLAKMFIDTLGKEKAFDVLTKEYLLDERKAKLCLEAYEREEKLMAGRDKKPCSVYVSIPFCPTRCDYCSFVSCTTPRFLSLIPEYLEKLHEEIRTIGNTVRDIGLNVESVYVGGGTPAILDERQTHELLCVMQNSIPETDKCEFTFEAGRPDCITEGKLRVLKDHGIGRISINPQTTNDDVLKSVGRNHTSKQFFDAYLLARKVGFDCINTDLIAALPTDTVTSFEKSVDAIAALSPENVTVHSFTLKKSSVFRTKGETDVTERFEDARRMTDYAYDKLKLSGYAPYYVYRQKNTVGDLDNTGYAKDGFESVYNIVMMGERHTVLSAGAGAVTKLVDRDSNVSRAFAPKYPYEYLDDNKYKGFDAQSIYDFYSDNIERK